MQANPLLFLALLLHPAAGWLWYRFTKWEVAQNAAAILANGSQDNLRKGFHSRRSWARLWPWLGCSLVPNVPLLLCYNLSIYIFLIGCAGLGALLLAYFCRFFTPLLNLARGLPYWHASGDSASWPDAAAYKRARAWPNLTDADCARLADQLLGQLLRRVWLAGIALYLLALVGLGVLGWG